jgi:hypothetical protein
MFKHFRDVIAFLALSQCGIRNVHAFELKQAQDQALICVYTNAARLVPQDYARVFAVKFSCPTVNNLDPLYGSDQLCSSALDHSMKMARFNCFRHDTCGPCTSKCTFIDRIRSVLPSASGYAENIASGFDSAFTFVVSKLARDPLHFADFNLEQLDRVCQSLQKHFWQVQSLMRCHV